MHKRFFILILTVIVIVFIGAKPAPASVNSFIAITNNPGNIDNSIFEDIVADFDLLTNLLTEIINVNDYPVPVNASDLPSAIAQLSGGFDHSLASALAVSYLQYVPAINAWAIVPTDSIPIITASDKSFSHITLIDATTARLIRIYSDCYNPGDRYWYQVTVKKYDSGWKIINLELEPIASNSGSG